MNLFSRMWEAKGGGKVQHPAMIVLYEGDRPPLGLRARALMSKLFTRTKVELIPAIPFTLGPTTNDYKHGYAERRVKRVQAEEAAGRAMAADDKVFISGYSDGLHPGDNTRKNS